MASGSRDGGARAHVLVIPYPAQGHMLPLLDLAHHLSAGGLAVTVLVTPANLHLLRPLLSRAPAIRTLVLPLPPHPSLPPGVENAKDLSPGLFLSLKHALGSLRDPIVRWARSAASPPDVIVSDFFLGWTQRVAAELGIPRVTFCPSGDLFLSIVHCLWREMPKRTEAADDDEFPVAFPGIPGSPVFPWRHLSSTYRGYRAGDEAWEFVRQGFLDNVASWGYVFNTFADLERMYLRHLRDDLGHPRVWAVGPLGPPGGGDRGGDPEVTPAARASLTAWLDRCPAGSVVYVCFGSQITLTRRQTDAVGAALELSGARFVWCVREPPAGGSGCGAEYGLVPEGFEGRTAGRGLVVRGWAPQVAILGHPAVGALLSHCGWNSVLEGVAAGVTLLAWPMGADQFVNARLLVEEAGVGVRACEGSDAVPDPEELARVVAESVGGRRSELAAAAARLRRSASEAVGERGSSDRDLQELVAAIWQLKRPPADQD